MSMTNQGVDTRSFTAASLRRSMSQLLPRKSTKSKNLQQFVVALDDNRTIYLPGQRVEGHVSVTFAKATSVRLLRIRISGHVATHMTKNNVSLSNHLSTMVLFKDFTNLGGTGTPEELHVEFAPGESVHPFSFRLPASALPASFEGAYGRVRYEVTAVLMMPGHTKKTTSIPITVPSTVSETTHDFSDPVEESSFVDTTTWGWKTGHVDIVAKLPKSGFLSEEIAPLTFELTNHSKEPVAINEVCIKQKVTYKMINEIRGPRTERIHKLNYTEIFSPDVRKITRYIQAPIPSVSLLSPFIDTPILSVSHFFVIKVTAGKSKGKISLPFMICGFPWHAFEVDGQPLMETLPRYEPRSLSSEVSDSTHEVVAEESQGVETREPDETLGLPSESLESSSTTLNGDAEEIGDEGGEEMEEGKDLRTKDSACNL